MPSKLGREESMVLLIAAVASAAALGAAGFSLGPHVLDPRGLVLAFLLVSGLAGVITTWVSSGRPYALPLSALPLLFCRAVLAAIGHGWPPWHFSPVDWLLGDGFPAWAGAMLVTAAYAGALARCYIRAASGYAAVQADPSRFYQADAEFARGNVISATRLVLFPFFFGAVLAALTGTGEGILVRICATAFLLAGVRFAGLVNARSMRTIWLARGVETGPNLERDWWRGHAKPFWFLLALLPLMPGGFQPIDPRGLVRRLLGTAPPPPPRPLPLPRLRDLPTEFPQHTGLFGKIFALVLHVLSLFFTFLGVCAVLAALFFILRRILLRLKGWYDSLGPLWEGIRRFCASLVALLRGTLARGSGALRRSLRWGQGRVRPGSLRPRWIWPASRIRMLFARLVIWGREEGLGLPPTFAPAEFAARLAEHVPERKEDLAYLVEIYHRERYGGLKPGHKERRLYRKAWERVIRGGSSATPDRHSS